MKKCSNSYTILGRIWKGTVQKMPEPILTYRGAIYPWHCDHMGHMNVMWYVGKFDEATWQFFLSFGLPRSRFSSEGTGGGHMAAIGYATVSTLDQKFALPRARSMAACAVRWWRRGSRTEPGGAGWLRRWTPPRL